MLTDVDAIFEKFSRKIPVTVDHDGWETVIFHDADIQILSMDRSSNNISWKRPLALALSKYHVKVLDVRTQSN